MARITIDGTPKTFGTKLEINASISTREQESIVSFQYSKKRGTVWGKSWSNTQQARKLSYTQD